MYKDPMDVVQGHGKNYNDPKAKRGTELLRLFKKHELMKQWRAKEKIHNERMTQL